MKTTKEVKLSLLCVNDSGTFVIKKAFTLSELALAFITKPFFST